jgi:hypothetical protein
MGRKKLYLTTLEKKTALRKNYIRWYINKKYGLYLNLTGNSIIEVKYDIILNIME